MKQNNIFLGNYGYKTALLVGTKKGQVKETAFKQVGSWIKDYATGKCRQATHTKIMILKL